MFKDFEDYLIEDVLGFTLDSKTSYKLVKKDNGDNELKVLAPEAKKEDIEIELEDDIMHITVNSKTWGKTSYHTYVPANFDTSKITSTLQDGVLCITLPLKEEAKPRKIVIS